MRQYSKWREKLYNNTFIIIGFDIARANRNNITQFLFHVSETFKNLSQMYFYQGPYAKLPLVKCRFACIGFFALLIEQNI